MLSVTERFGSPAVGAGWIVVHKCIGCGAVDTPQPCLGTCAEHRLDLVRADDHAEATARLAALEESLASMRELVSQLAASPPREADWPALRARARWLSHPEPAPVAGEVTTAWACESCGRIEAPQPCLGVCIRPEVSMIAAAEHAAVLADAGACQREIDRFAPLVRRLALVTPRPGRWAETARAFQAQARAV